jgi:hypothetical protein
MLQGSFTRISYLLLSHISFHMDKVGSFYSCEKETEAT